ncbi:MAG: class I SAM-dependent methyltransferase [Candidatus Daviesbacteria bacterium]|nr:class I SAM-dependent methyltransferase [Candidatus Daviesbacteria bacterium]
MSNSLFKKYPHCRFCLNKNLIKVIDLGNQPAANAFLSNKQLKEKEPYFPLKVNICSKCGLLQLTHVVSPDYLFRNYVYVSSTSPVFVAHFEKYAQSVYKKIKLNKDSLVIDIGSNDGILLKPFKKLGMKVLGVDPARKIARQATKNGIPTIPEYFDQQLANQIIKKWGFADAITFNNVFAHVPYIDELILAANKLLNNEGVLIIEAPYLVDLLQKNLFDTIYHEHVSYLSVRPLQTLFKRFNMTILDVEETDSHGGSIRVFVKKNESKRKVEESVDEFIKTEKKLGLANAQTYKKFAKKIDQNKKDLNKLLRKLKSKGKTIIGYGAPAKGNTLLNYFDIGPEILDYIVDDSSYKQGLFTPGMHIPVVSSEEILTTKPNYIFILAWNFADSIMKKLSDYKQDGGKFIIPVPKPIIV